MLMQRTGEVGVERPIALELISLNHLTAFISHKIRVDGEQPAIDVRKWQTYHIV